MKRRVIRIMQLNLATLFCLFGTISSTVYSQEHSAIQKSFQLTFGGTHNRLVDEWFTQKRVKFSGTFFTSQLKYEKQTPKFRFTSRLSYSKGKVKNADDNVKVNLHDLRISIAYQKNLVTHSIFGKDAKLHVGPQLSMVDYVLIDQDILENLTLTFNNTLDILLTECIMLNNQNQLVISVALPLFGFVKRESSDGGVNTQLEDDYEDNFLAFLFQGSKAKFVSPLSLPRIDINYILDTKGKTDFIFNYQFNFLKNRQASPIFLYGNRFMLGFKFGF